MQKCTKFIKTIKFIYIRQGNHPDQGAHAKFTNYSFDVDEFLSIVKIAERHVENRRDFNEFVDNSNRVKTRDEL